MSHLRLALFAAAMLMMVGLCPGKVVVDQEFKTAPANARSQVTAVYDLALLENLTAHHPEIEAEETSPESPKRGREMSLIANGAFGFSLWGVGLGLVAFFAMGAPSFREKRG